MSDQIVVMSEGRIAQIGEPRDLYSRPVSRFVAGFVGETNVFDCVVQGVEAGHVVAQCDGLLIRATANGTNFRAGQCVSVIVRPESIRCLESGAPGENTVKATIVQRIFKGTHTAVLVQTKTGRKLKVMSNASDAVALSSEDLWASWSADDAVVLRD